MPFFLPLCIHFLSCTCCKLQCFKLHLSVRWCTAEFSALFRKMRQKEINSSFFPFEAVWSNFPVPVCCWRFTHQVHVTTLVGTAHGCYLCTWNMCEGNEDNDYQKHAPLSQPSAWMQGLWKAAVQGCWFLCIVKHAQLVSQLEFPVDFSRWSFNALKCIHGSLVRSQSIWSTLGR